jgi:hypothetical protein
MTKTLADNCCRICGIPLDAEYFDVSGFVGTEGEAFTLFKDFGLQGPAPLPQRGEQVVLTSFQLHPQYCGVLTYFSQYTDLYVSDNTKILTPGFEWSILQNGKPVFPYTRLEHIVNPWGYNCLPVLIRLDENARVQFVLRNRGIKDEDLKAPSPSKPPKYPIRAFAGRIMGRYWYNDSFGGRGRL